MRRYWVQNLSGPGVSYDDDGDGWFSRANLFLALYAEVEAQGLLQVASNTSASLKRCERPRLQNGTVR